MTFGNGTVGALAFVYVAYVARKLGPAEYASFAIALSLHGIFSLALGTVQNLITNFTKRYRTLGVPQHSGILVRTSVRYLLLVFALGAGPVGYFALPLSDALNLGAPRAVIVTAYGMGALSMLLGCYRGVLLGHERYGSFNVNAIAEAVVRIAAGVTLLVVLPSVVGALFAYVTAMAVVMALSLVQTRKLLLLEGEGAAQDDAVARVAGTAAGNALEGVTAYLVPLLLQSAAFASLIAVDAMMAKYYLSDADAGMYLAASQIARFLLVVAASFSSVVINLAAESRVLGRRPRRRLLELVAYYGSLGVGFVIVTSLLGRTLIGAAFGAGFAGAASLLWPLCGGVMFSGVTLMLCHYLLALGYDKVALFPLVGVAVELLLLRAFHAGGEQVARMFLLSQFVVALMLGLFLWLAKPDAVVLADRGVSERGSE